MIFRNNIRKIIIFAVILVFIGSLGLSLKRAKAQIPVTDVAHIAVTTTHTTQDFIKNYIIKPLVRTLANALENMIVNKITAQISGVKQGQPSFITNWRNEILDSQGRGNDVFRSILADTGLCPYFGQNMKTAFGADSNKYGGSIKGSTVTAKDKNGNDVVVYQNKTTTPGLPSFQTTANCTLSPDINVILFKKDFSQGGWATWNELIKPQNNFFGAYSLALGEQSRQISIESQSSQNKSIAGQGYIGSKLGPNTGTGTSACLQSCQSQQATCNKQAASGLLGGSATECANIAASCTANCPPSAVVTNNAGPNGCVGTGGVNRCIFVGKEVTPPKLIADLNSTALGTKISRAGFGQELSDVIGGLVGAVVTGLLQGLTNFAGQNGYNVAPAINNGLFNEAGANQASQASATGTNTNVNALTACTNQCTNSFNSCMKQNSPAQNPLASGEYTYICSDDLESCNSNCRSAIPQ